MRPWLTLTLLLLGCAGGAPSDGGARERGVRRYDPQAGIARPAPAPAPATPSPPPAPGEEEVPRIVAVGEARPPAAPPPRPRPEPERSVSATPLPNDGTHVGFTSDLALALDVTARLGRERLMALVRGEREWTREVRSVPGAIDVYLGGAPARARGPLRDHRAEVAAMFIGLDELPERARVGGGDPGELPVRFVRTSPRDAGPLLGPIYVPTEHDAAAEPPGARVVRMFTGYVVPALKKAHVALRGTPFTQVGIVIVYPVVDEGGARAEALAAVMQREDVSSLLRDAMPDRNAAVRSTLRVIPCTAAPGARMQRLALELDPPQPTAPDAPRADDAPAPADMPDVPDLPRGAESVGTGFVVAPDTVLTNAHVVAGARAISVDVGRRRLRAAVIARDEALDLALLRLPPNTAGGGLTFAVAPPRPGAEVFAYGYGSLGGSNDTLLLTRGAVSAVEPRRIVFDAKVNPGNSGGPLVDVEGHVVGVVARKSRSSEVVDSLSMAIPSGPAVSFLGEHGVAARQVARAERSERDLPPDERLRPAVVRIVAR